MAASKYGFGPALDASMKALLALSPIKPVSPARQAEKAKQIEERLAEDATAAASAAEEEARAAPSSSDVVTSAREDFYIGERFEIVESDGDADPHSHLGEVEVTEVAFFEKGTATAVSEVCSSEIVVLCSGYTFQAHVSPPRSPLYRSQIGANDSHFGHTLAPIWLRIITTSRSHYSGLTRMMTTPR